MLSFPSREHIAGKCRMPGPFLSGRRCVRPLFRSLISHTTHTWRSKLLQTGTNSPRFPPLLQWTRSGSRHGRGKRRNGGKHPIIFIRYIYISKLDRKLKSLTRGVAHHREFKPEFLALKGMVFCARWDTISLTTSIPSKPHFLAGSDASGCRTFSGIEQLLWSEMSSWLLRQDPKNTAQWWRNIYVLLQIMSGFPRHYIFFPWCTKALA